ncbi:MAG: hypothetical protein K2K93_05965 [Muribaculaceae bacterium]|nr:hypothetical protein [Muribaculaceae bacterium]
MLTRCPGSETDAMQVGVVLLRCPVSETDAMQVGGVLPPFPVSETDGDVLRGSESRDNDETPRFNAGQTTKKMKKPRRGDL